MSASIVIYGATGGIGSALARQLASAGQPLVLVGRDAGRLAALADECVATSCNAPEGGSPQGAAITVEGDACDPGLHARVAEAVGERCRGLVYAVGNLRLGPLSRVEPSQALADFQLHALGALMAAQALTAALKNCADGSAIVLCSSIAARSGFPNHASVSMAKGAVEGLTMALAAELAPKVRVNAIAPSLTRTPLAQPLTGNEKLAAGIAALHPLPRLGEAQDAAQAIEFLLSERSSWITGQILPVDGGHSSVRSKG